MQAKSNGAGIPRPEKPLHVPQIDSSHTGPEDKDYAIESDGSPSIKFTSNEKEQDIDIEDQTHEQDESIHPAPVKVPRSQRRGLLSRFAILAEVEQPVHYSRNSKWFITFVVAAAAIAAPLGSAIFFRMPQAIPILYAGSIH